jgi:hypothetical protein
MIVDPATGQEWTPEFEGQRPPFQPGNDLALKHGIHSPRTINPIAQAHYDQLMGNPHLPAPLRMPMMEGSIRRFCETVARRDRLADWVEGMTMAEATRSDKGQTSPMELLRKWETTTDSKARDLGLTPASYARIYRDWSQANQLDAATLLTQARAAAENPDADTPS